MGLPSAPGPEPPAPTLSLAERDRRWQAVQTHAARAGLAGIFVPLCLDGRNFRLSLEQARGARSDGRYLTLLDNAAVVLPTDGRPPIVITDRGEGNAWVPQPRPAVAGRRGSWVDAMVEALREAGLERGRIGVVGLGRGKYTHGRAVDGVVNHSAYVEVVRRLPNARFEDATDVVGLARYVKSEEEVACLRHAARIAVAGLEEMAQAARPGVDAAVLYARVMRRMLALGSEYYPLALYCGPPDARRLRHEDPPLGQRLQPGDLITNETDAVWAGLIAQELQPIVLGPVPATWQPVIELQRDLYYAGLERLRPGTLVGELIDFINDFGARRGLGSQILMHGRGYGNDGPLLTPQDRRADFFRDVPLLENNVFVWKPIAYSADGRFQLSWGGVVRVTARGGEPLVPRAPGVVAIT
jgi:Xaa-Pro aminopeptidase